MFTRICPGTDRYSDKFPWKKIPKEWSCLSHVGVFGKLREILFKIAVAALDCLSVKYLARPSIKKKCAYSFTNE
jgi:hypothetical protein